MLPYSVRFQQVHILKGATSFMSSISLEIACRTNLQSEHVVLTFHTLFGMNPTAHPAIDPGFYYSHLPLRSSILSFPILTQTFTISSTALIDKVPPTLSTYCIDKICGYGKVNLWHFLGVSISND